MVKLRNTIGLTLGVAVGLIALLLALMRFSDGPLEVFSGGPFTTGELTTAPDDWSFLADRGTVEFQTLQPARSRTVWLAVHDQRLFLVSGYMNTSYGGIWKQWPHYLDHDDHLDHNDHLNHDDHRICKEVGGSTQASWRLSDPI